MWRRLEPGRRRLGLSAALGSWAALAVALVDASWARSGHAKPPGLWSVYWAEAGVLVPLGLVVGLVVGLGSWFLHPRVEPTVPRFFEWLRNRATGHPADVAAFLPLAVLAAFGWATLSAQLARRLLAMDLGPWLCGSAVAVGALGLGLLFGLGALGLTPLLRTSLARLSARSRLWVDPPFTLALGLGACAVLLGVGIGWGGVSGQGGLLGIYGVLKRQALDLRRAACLLALGAVAYLAPPLLAGLRRPLLAWVAALVPLGFTAHAAAALNEKGDVALLIERGAPLGKRPLSALRQLSDRDGDGASPWFAGGDCDDRDPAIGPAGEEVPDNGIDEDCSGSDLSLAAIAAAEPPPQPPKPDRFASIPEDANLVLIVVDTLRYDVGYMGYDRPITPNIDALARRSTIFERAYALASYTGKAVGPMLIGKYGSETHRNWGHFNRFGEEDIFVAQRFKRAGIRTISVQGHRYFGRFGGLERGFDVLDLSAAPPEGAKWAKDSSATSDKLTDAAIAALEASESQGKRFFLWVQYLDPHEDYIPHKDVPSFGRKARDLYDAEVVFTDRHVGRLLDYIAQSPSAERTCVVLTSDHGEAFGEHGMWRHGFELWEVLVRVPLLVHVPGLEPSVVKARRSQIDLVPTMLELMRLPLPEPCQEQPCTDFISGQSLLPDMLLEPGKEAAERDVIIDMPAGPYNDSRRAFIHGDLKLIISRGSHKELYDLASDPEESRNIWAKDRARIEDRYAAAKARLREIEVTGKRK